MPTSRASAIFAPRSLVLVGASDRPGSLGAVVLANLREAGFRGPIHLVHPDRERIGADPVFRSVRDVPGEVDLAIIVTPAAAVPGVVADCGERGVRGAIVMSAGFRETGDGGAALERAVLDEARRHGLRLLGPNCLGVIRTDIGFNGTFSAGNALPGRIGLVSQSGALCTAILDWARVNGVGFSSVISTGIGADLDFDEILDYLALDPRTDSIMLYIEGVHAARPFMSALRAAARIKPVVVMKAGRHAEGSRAALSHTGALVGSDAVFDAALRRAGVLRTENFADFFAAAATLGAGMRSTGTRIAIVTNAGGPGVMAADRAADRGLSLAALGPAALARLDGGLPPQWSRANPVDLLGDAGPERYGLALTSCLADPGVDAVIVILTPQALTAPEAVARVVIGQARDHGKPVLACWMGESAVASSRGLFSTAGVPAYRTPEAAVDAFAAISAFGESQRQLLQVPEPLTRQQPPDVEGARLVIDAALAEGRTVLTLPESKAVLAAFHVPIVPSLPARSAAEAVTVASEIGYPVALKILSPDITHKSDVGGVRLGLADARAVRREFQDLVGSVARLAPAARIDGVVVEPMAGMAHGRELMAGVARDEIFGPVISFGLGGTLVEIMGDSAVALPPLNASLVADLVGRTRAGRYLGPFRGAEPADAAAVRDLLLRVSEMVCELPALEALDLNPVIASAAGVRVVDARLVVARERPAARPYDHMAIHPYPSGLVRSLDLTDGTPVVLRPIRPEDAVIERDFVNGLSGQTRYLRFMYAIAEITPAMLARFTQIDYDREMALVAVVQAEAGEQEIGVARYTTLPDGESCEFAIVVADAWQRRGLGWHLLGALIAVARERRLKRMQGAALVENTGMVRLARALGFTVEPDPAEGGLVRMRLELG